MALMAFTIGLALQLVDLLSQLQTPFVLHQGIVTSTAVVLFTVMSSRCLHASFFIFVLVFMLNKRCLLFHGPAASDLLGTPALGQLISCCGCCGHSLASTGH